MYARITHWTVGALALAALVCSSAALAAGGPAAKRPPSGGPPGGVWTCDYIAAHPAVEVDEGLVSPLDTHKGHFYAEASFTRFSPGERRPLPPGTANGYGPRFVVTGCVFCTKPNPGGGCAGCGGWFGLGLRGGFGSGLSPVWYCTM